MKKLGIAVIFVMALCSFAGMASATEYSAAVTIDSIMPIRADRPADTVSTSYMRIYFGAASSIGSLCRNSAADLLSNDANKQILATLLTAFAQGKQVTIYVDSTLKADNDDVCEVTLIRVYK
jgi:hypothetical protein